MTIKEYKEKIEKLEFELEQKIKTINDLQQDIITEKNYRNTKYIPISKINNVITRLSYQTENEYCDFAIMILNMILGGKDVKT